MGNKGREGMGRRGRGGKEGKRGREIGREGEGKVPQRTSPRAQRRLRPALPLATGVQGLSSAKFLEGSFGS
jgi:hypothetical protein